MDSRAERQVTVSLPYFGCRTFVRRAVESILGQTHGDLTLIVLNDGDDPEPWDLLADIKDDRLVRFDLDANRGRYFADAVALAATSDRYFMVQDADDWSALDRLTLLYETMRENHADAAFSAVHEHSTGRGVTKLSYPACTEIPAPVLRMVSSHFGLVRTQALRAIGGYYGGFRIGYDRLLIALLALTARMSYLDEPLYNRDVRPQSLSNSAETGMGSKARWTARAELDAIYEQAYAAFCRFASGRCRIDELCRSIAAITQANVSASDAMALSGQSGRLRASLLTDRQKRTQSSWRPLTAWTSLPQPSRRVARSRRTGGVNKAALSVVFPTRHDTDAVPATIESFLAARTLDTPVEFIVVDDASPAGIDRATLERQVGSKGRNAWITVVRSSRHIGITRARNLGACCATGDRLFITDAHVEVGSGWDSVIEQYAGNRRVLAATSVDQDTGAPGYGGSLQVPTMTMSWNTEPAGNPGPVQIATSIGMVIDRNLYWTIGGFDTGMIRRGSAEAELSLRAWLRGAEILNVPDLVVRHRFRGTEERNETMRRDLHFTLQNRLRFAFLYLAEEVALQVLREMAVHYPGPAVAQACDLVVSSDVWARRSVLREQELLSFNWFLRKFGLETMDHRLAAVSP